MLRQVHSLDCVGVDGMRGMCVINPLMVFMMVYEYGNDLIVCSLLVYSETDIPTFVFVDTCVQSGCHALYCIATNPVSQRVYLLAKRPYCTKCLLNYFTVFPQLMPVGCYFHSSVLYVSNVTVCSIN